MIGRKADILPEKGNFFIVKKIINDINKVCDLGAKILLFCHTKSLMPSNENN
jgi:hypothetical protein